MPAAFSDIAFTPSVKAAQSRYGSRQANLGFETMPDRGNKLTQRETDFIAKRDSFYQATVSETGWPYVQHRGGPLGFLKVLDAQTIGYADFRGNVQYLSVGNLAVNDRVTLILMDYANRGRLKLWGRARIVHEADSPDWVARLASSDYRARIERGVIINVQAYDWNCPQHITPRYSKLEIEHLLAPLAEENQALKAKCATLSGTSTDSSGCGSESRK